MKKALFIGLISMAVGLTTMTARAVTVEQAVNTILECGLKGVELYEFRLQGGLLIAKIGDRYIRNVSVTQGDEIQFDLVTPASVVSYTLARRGVRWEDSSNDLTLGNLCMRPMEQQIAAVN